MSFPDKCSSPINSGDVYSFTTRHCIEIPSITTSTNSLYLYWTYSWWLAFFNFFFFRQACAISACGNFAILGTESGWIERFNLQSGISRGSYIDDSESQRCAHDGEVVGIACDATNSIMISAGYQGDIKVVATGWSLIFHSVSLTVWSCLILIMEAYKLMEIYFSNIYIAEVKLRMKLKTKTIYLLQILVWRLVEHLLKNPVSLLYFLCICIDYWSSRNLNYKSTYSWMW